MVTKRRVRIATGIFALFVATAIPIVAWGSPPERPPATKATTAKPINKPRRPAAPAGPITVTTPMEDAQVSRVFIVSGNSQTTGGIVGWELRYEGVTIDSGSAKGGELSPGPFSFQVRVPTAGSYEIALFESRGAAGGYSKLTVRRVQAI